MYIYVFLFAYTKSFKKKFACNNRGSNYRKKFWKASGIYILTKNMLWYGIILLHFTLKLKNLYITKKLKIIILKFNAYYILSKVFFFCLNLTFMLLYTINIFRIGHPYHSIYTFYNRTDNVQSNVVQNIDFDTSCSYRN